MAELICPVCKADSYFNPAIKIYISPCFHKICESCLYKIFQQGHAPCPECGTILRRINFITSTFEDIEVEKELKMRKLLNRHFYSEMADFEDEVSYNDYLEEYENVLFEFLEYKNENIVKERINEIKATNSILVRRQEHKEGEKEVEKIKKVKIEENWCLYKQEKSRMFSIDEDVTIPKDFINPFTPAGLKKKEILEFLEYSLAELLTG
ncbi:TFIIH/NER complex subunit [Glugoides intestinalis]